MSLEEERRVYWAWQMELAHGFMGEIMQYPVEECGERLVGLVGAVADAGVEVAFAQTEISPGLERQFYLREGLIPQFLAIASDLNAQGLVLKVEDAYRSPDMQRQLCLRQGIFDIVLQRVMW